MGKYMRKAKITADVAVMDVSQSSLGVRTRAKTLALQRLQSTAPASSPNSELSYLQLRNRRLEKPSLLGDCKKNQEQQQRSTLDENMKQKPSPLGSSRLGLNSVNSGSVGSVSINRSNKEDRALIDVAVEQRNGEETEDCNNFSIEASFGENNLDYEGRGRSTRESTPCSFIRDPDVVGTPGSSSRPISSNATNRRTWNTVQRSIPTTLEMEEFFASAEQQQQRLFTEKYNFDFVNELPLPGRYEWTKVGL